MQTNMRTLFSNFLRTKKLFYEYSKFCANNIIYSQIKQITKFSNDSQKQFNSDKNVESDSHNLIGSISTTHKIFEDKNAEIIFDISERQEKVNLEDLIIEEHHDPYEGINLERGKSGVFEIEDLVSLLQKDNVKNIFVASMSSELSYADYIVIVTGRSNKHMKALASFVRKVYKLKKHKTDILVKIEGKNSKDWIALDLGNIILHIFSHSARLEYDLETLWSVGPDYDDKSKNITEDIMEQYNEFLSDLEPIENNNKNGKCETYKK